MMFGLRKPVAILIWSVVAISAIVCSLAVIVFTPISILIRDKQRHLLHNFGIIWGRFVLTMFPGWKISVFGKENLAPKNVPVVYVANHLSQADILTAFYLGMRFRFLAKDSIFKVPLMGWAMKLIGYVGIKRGKKNSHERVMRELKEHLAQKTAVFFFPEGTRSPDGVLRPFKAGAFRLAVASGVSIIPITFVGTNKMLPNGSCVPDAAKIQIIVHKAIESKGLTDDDLMAAARKAIRDALPLEQQGDI